MTSLRKMIVPAMLGAAVAVGAWGCANEHPSLVPADAQAVAVGQQRLQYAAPHDGMVYVYNVSNDKLLYSGPIKEGQSVVVDRTANRIMLDGRVVMNKELGNGTLKIYFDRNGSLNGAAMTHTQQQTTETRTERYNSD